MRIYDRASFLLLPPGTLYCAGTPWVFGALHVKEETLAGGIGDWFCRSLNDIESHDSGEWHDRLEEMAKQGTCYPLETAVGRDTMYEDDAVFLVYESADLDDLAAVIARAKAAAVS